MTRTSSSDLRVQPPADLKAKSAFELQGWLARIAKLQGTQGLWEIWQTWPGTEKQKLALWGQWTAGFMWAADVERRELQKKLGDQSQAQRAQGQEQRAADKARVRNKEATSTVA
jgi:hypothetical protein